MSNQITARRGLSESLEEYAARAGMSRAAARPIWRVLGLDALHVLSPLALASVLVGHCRVAPGVAVPIPGLTPADVLEENHDFTTITAPEDGL